jgi:hypothetical protein
MGPEQDVTMIKVNQAARFMAGISFWKRVVTQSHRDRPRHHSRTNRGAHRNEFATATAGARGLHQRNPNCKRGGRAVAAPPFLYEVV